jgi:hypothetical protein
MRRKKMNSIFKGIILIILLLFGFIAFIGFHENAHMEIYKHYGSEPEFRLSWRQAAVIGSCNGNEDCNYLHNLNEVFGYHLAALVINFWLMFVVYLVWREK